MKIFGWPVTLIWVLLRNQIWLKPRAWSAHRIVRKLISSAGYDLKFSELCLGLGEASNLSLVLVFRTDEDLKKIQESPLPEEIRAAFHQKLKSSGYPEANTAGVTLHSNEEIMRHGGYYPYFK